jgi:hypothetical protein
VVNGATASVIDELDSLELTVVPWELGTVGDDWISWATAEEATLIVNTSSRLPGLPLRSSTASRLT